MLKIFQPWDFNDSSFLYVTLISAFFHIIDFYRVSQFNNTFVINVAEVILTLLSSIITGIADIL
jgi:hypothetical protein